MPTGEPAAHHCHVCQNCLHIWWHCATDGERRGIHLCPKCGSGPYYFGFDTKREALEERAALKSTEVLAAHRGSNGGLRLRRDDCLRCVLEKDIPSMTMPDPRGAVSAEDIDARAREAMAKLEHGSDEHRQWLRETGVPIIADAIRVAILTDRQRRGDVTTPVSDVLALRRALALLHRGEAGVSLSFQSDELGATIRALEAALGKGEG